MKKQTLIALALGSAMGTTSFSTAALAAGDNPFSAKSLNGGYQLAQAESKQKDGKCGEAKCGADKKTANEKKLDGKCGEAKCGADKKRTEKKKEEKCGEAKCGANKE